MIDTHPEEESLPALENIASREEAIERCIGPLGSLIICCALDRLTLSPEVVVPSIQDVIEELTYDGAVIDADDGWTVHSVASAALLSTLEIDEATEVCKLVAAQLEIFKTYTYEQEAGSVLVEGLSAQEMIPSHYVLPAFLTQEKNTAIAPAQRVVSAGYLPVPQEIAALCRREDYQATLHGFCFGPNGTYASFEDVPMETAHAKYTKSPVAKTFEPPSIANLCERKPDGTIRESWNTISFLRALLKADNKYQIINNPTHDSENLNSEGQSRTHGSRGCPLALSTPKNRAHISQEDFTTHQWQLFTGGDNPVAKYDAKTASYRIERLAISELSNRTADFMDHAAALLRPATRKA